MQNAEIRFASPVPFSRPETIVADSLDPCREQQQMLANQKRSLLNLTGAFVHDTRNQHQIPLEITVETVERGDRSLVLSFDSVKNRNHPVISFQHIACQSLSADVETVFPAGLQADLPISESQFRLIISGDAVLRRNHPVVFRGAADPEHASHRIGSG